MFLSIGIESPKHDDEAYGIAVPALCIGDYGCFGAADESANIAECAQDAIDGILLAMAEDEFDIDGIVDLGALEYQKMRTTRIVIAG
ncbi:DNA-binding protein CopG family [Photobacterium aphoticum]|uniref:DNA-binding protein CopG family n=1 Tax=Photobacterium aphoticum TaxID=754436 RepID=A0A090QYG0_9GAMM|nr:DNA-binding protein CopG family [Photobacterium aphoticum]